jgi:hypothetical protein
MDVPDLRDRCSRRRVIAGLGAAVSAALAGCGSTNDDSTPAEPTFDRLDATSVHVDDGVDLSLPAAVSTVENTHNAELLVLPGDAAVGTERVADWLADGKSLGLLGQEAEATWLEWARSEAVREHFDTQGVSDADPDPQLVVAAAVGLSLPTFRSTWSDEPTGRDVMKALDDALVDISDRRESAQ